MACAPCMAVMLAADGPNLHELAFYAKTGRPPARKRCPCMNCAQSLIKQAVKHADSYGGGAAGGAGIPDTGGSGTGDGSGTDWTALLAKWGPAALAAIPGFLSAFGGGSKDQPAPPPPPPPPPPPANDSKMLWEIALIILIIFVLTRKPKASA